MISLVVEFGDLIIPILGGFVNGFGEILIMELGGANRAFYPL
jgi:hypothetical protein